MATAVGSPDRARFDSPQQEAYLNLWRTYDRLRAIEDEMFAQHGLTAQQYNALRILKSVRPDGLATLELQRRLISRAPDITRLVDRLVELGFAHRTRAEGNRRQVRVAITTNGVKLLRRMAAEVRQCHERQVGHMTASELRQLIALLHKVRAPHEEPEHPWALDV
jgi:DNA-binding MarR family transcriptional regulator